MTGLDLSPAHARTRLGALIDAGDDVDAITAYARAVWTTLIEPGDRVAGALIAALGPVRALEVAHGSGAVDADVDPEEVERGRARWMPRARAESHDLGLAQRSRVRLVTPEDSAWPTALDDLGPFAPVCLWVRGDVDCLGGAAVALVGARASTSYGEMVTADIAAEAVVAGVTVCSGGAYGIDGAAHRAALLAGGVTVAVMAGGVERAYPAGHRDLLERITTSGAVVSEVPCGSAPTKHRFLARNRVIAALSSATVVVEAGWRSGALNTAHHAAAIGRPVGAVPGPVTSAASMGCHRLLREGSAVCVTAFPDVADLLGVSPTPIAAEGDGYTGDRTRILDALSARTPRSTEDVAGRAGFAVDEAASLLGLLELEGLVVRRAMGWVQESPTATLW